MNRKRAMQKVKNGFSEKVYEKESQDRWRVYAHDIFGIKTYTTSRVPNRVFAEHRASGSNVIFHDGFFETEAVEEERVQVLIVESSRPALNQGAAIGGLAGALLGSAIEALMK